MCTDDLRQGTGTGKVRIGRDEVTELCCNLDDMTAEAMAFAAERLMEQGALDVTLSPVTMKKGRPGTQLTVLCRPADEETLAHAVLRETTSNGVRVRRCERYVLEPSIQTVQSPYGPIRIKCADGDGISHRKPEYEDAVRVARESGEPFEDVRERMILSQLPVQAPEEPSDAESTAAE